MADADKGREYLDRMALTALAPMDLLPELTVLWEAGLPSGEKTGWPSVDQHYTVVEGQFTVVTGWPSSGKSEWLDALLVNLSRKGWRFAIFSPENQPVELHAAKMLEKLSGQPFGAGPTERISREMLPELAKQLSESFRFIPTSENPLSVKAVIDAASPWLLSQRRRGLIIDPWNELEHWRPPGLSETEYVSQQLSYVRTWARKHAVHVWIVAHPQKMRAPDGKLPIPRPDMISGSQNWWNKADCAVTIWRDLEQQNAEIEVHVQKVRFKHVGRPGVVTLKWDRVTGRYSDVPKLREVSAYRARSNGEED